jgi:hypothetical protein
METLNLPDPILDQENLTLESARRDKLLEINGAFDRDVSFLLQGYPGLEDKFFPTLSSEVQAYNADSTAPTPLIDAIIAETGETKADYLKSVNERRAPFTQRGGQAMGRRRRAHTLIYAATTVEEVNAVTW